MLTDTFVTTNLESIRAENGARERLVVGDPEARLPVGSSHHAWLAYTLVVPTKVAALVGACVLSVAFIDVWRTETM